ncbi:MAG: M43 family zinc metalloprotease [Saprospiraceae bacterium]
MKFKQFFLKLGSFLIAAIFPFILHSQSDVLTQYRIYGTQKLEYIIGSNTILNDSLESEILKIDLSINHFKYNFGLKFHIIENDNLINDEIISNQLEILNQSFQATHFENFLDDAILKPFYQLSSSPNFNFCKSEPNTFINTADSFGINEFLQEKITSVSPLVSGSTIINIYIVDLVDDYSGLVTQLNLKNGFEAIIIDKKYFGINRVNVEGYDQGKTLVHLMASFLGLLELWNEFAPCSDDKVADTPIHNYANFSAGSLFKNISTCDGNEVEMIVNYMDNLPDEYCTMFTQGQVERMKKVCLSKYGRGNYNLKDCNEFRNKKDMGDNITIYSNPKSGDYSISTKQTLEEIEIKIYNKLGKEIYNKYHKKMEEGSKIEINLQNAESGIHALRIFSQNTLIKQINFVK